MRFDYQMQQFSAARSALMLPCEDQDMAFGFALMECHRGLEGFDLGKVDEPEVQGHLRNIQGCLILEGLEDPEGRGLFWIRARQLSVDERKELSRAIDEAANYFTRTCFED